MSKQVNKIESIDDAMAVIADLQEKLEASKAEGLQSENKELQEKLSANEEKLEATQKAVEAKETERKELAEKFEKIEAKYNELETKLRNESRFTKLAELGVELDDAKKQKYSAYSDETFDEVVAHIEQYKSAVESNRTTVVKDGKSDSELLENGTTKPKQEKKEDDEGFESADVDDADTVEDDDSDEDTGDDDEVEARVKVNSVTKEGFRKMFAARLRNQQDAKTA